MSEELWTEVRDIVQEALIKTIPKKMKYKKAKWLLRRTYTQLRKEKRSKRRKGKKCPFEYRVQNNGKERQECLPQ